MKLNLGLITNNKTVVRARTQEQFDALIDAYKEMYGNVRCCCKSCWNFAKKETCFQISNECYFGKNGTGYSSYTYYSKIGYSFLEFEELIVEEPKRGDRVLVKQSKYGEFKERIYVTTISGARKPYIFVDYMDEKKFENGEPFTALTATDIKPLPEKNKVVISAEEVTKLLQEKYSDDVLIEVKK